MTLKEYYTEAIKFAIYPEQYKIQYPLVGLGGEFGEVMDKIKKVWRDDIGFFSSESRKGIAKELGDVCWYIMACARDLDVVELVVNHTCEWWDESVFKLLKRGHIAISHAIANGDDSTHNPNDNQCLGVVLDVVYSIAVEIDYSMEEILQMNIDKLTARMEQDKMGGSGDDREEIITTSDRKLKCNPNLEVLKTSDDTPEFIVRMQQELIDVDSKLNKLNVIFEKQSTVTMTIWEAGLINHQRDSMISYFRALCERCILHNAVDYASVNLPSVK